MAKPSLFYSFVIPQARTRIEIIKASEIKIKFLVRCFGVNAPTVIQIMMKATISKTIPMLAHITVNMPFMERTFSIKLVAKSEGTVTIAKYPSIDGFSFVVA